jgi:hypothetical protein
MIGAFMRVERSTPFGSAPAEHLVTGEVSASSIPAVRILNLALWWRAALVAGCGDLAERAKIVADAPPLGIADGFYEFSEPVDKKEKA